MSGCGEDPTYADVAEWLPTDVREAVERGTPCRIFGDHFWQHTRAEIHTLEQVAPIRVIEQWYCQCGLVHTTNPKVTEMNVTLRLSPDIAHDDPIRRADGIRLNIGPGIFRVDIPMCWSAFPTTRTEDDTEVWEIRRRDDEECQ